MRFIIITGLSGAGRTQAIRRMEDLGFFCVDNLPPSLITEFAHICMLNSKDKVAVVVDMRMGVMFDDIYNAIDSLNHTKGILTEILFLDAQDDVIIRRFSETRRKHPLSYGASLTTGVALEREKLHRIKDMAQHVIDTSTYLPQMLAKNIDRLYSDIDSEKIYISVISFGFKRGIPLDADMVFDMRFIPNPFYISGLKEKTGLTNEVYDYVFSSQRAHEFIEKVTDLVDFMAPFYLEQDKKQLVIAIGCTGGMHRSVAVADELYKVFKEKQHNVSIEHRDILLDLQKD